MGSSASASTEAIPTKLFCLSGHDINEHASNFFRPAKSGKTPITGLDQTVIELEYFHYDLDRAATAVPIDIVFEIARNGHATTYSLFATCSPISALFLRYLSSQDHWLLARQNMRFPSLTYLHHHRCLIQRSQASSFEYSIPLLSPPHLSTQSHGCHSLNSNG